MFSDAEKKIVELERKLKVSSYNTIYIYRQVSTAWDYKNIESLSAAMLSGYVLWESVCIDVL
jgi:hypothetical protein